MEEDGQVPVAIKTANHSSQPDYSALVLPGFLGLGDAPKRIPKLAPSSAGGNRFVGLELPPPQGFDRKTAPQLGVD